MLKRWRNEKMKKIHKMVSKRMNQKELNVVIFQVFARTCTFFSEELVFLNKLGQQCV